ncbi:uncharacterized protein Rcd4 [Chelonus insularis]|uniref:uncharacterized protein Rcd4 n=1 Tax=Chelonus insularis TaxID=460826 RepID=UPI00158C14DE|nr:uncharacterized protein LOC118069486 [Chelonus insularis]
MQREKSEKVDPKSKKKPALVRSKSQARVMTMRNITGSKLNVQVDSGTVRARAKSFSSASDLKKKQSKVAFGTTVNPLSRPEYNTTIRTINKLEEVKREKIVIELDSLPSPYKSQVLKKVSSTLNFPSDKPIFKNLIDLNVNESQLPKVITRSKDPPPRPKDLQPKLSDFFTPQYGEEYVEAIKVKPRVPEIEDKWDAFRISDLIFSWKSKLDQDNFD